MEQAKSGKKSSIDNYSVNITICDHMYDESQSLLQYLYDEGKCGSICRGGKNQDINYY